MGKPSDTRGKEKPMERCVEKEREGRSQNEGVGVGFMGDKPWKIRVKE